MVLIKLACIINSNSSLPPLRIGTKHEHQLGGKLILATIEQKQYTGIRSQMQDLIDLEMIHMLVTTM
jgi:hypothetical protein